MDNGWRIKLDIPIVLVKVWPSVWELPKIGFVGPETGRDVTNRKPKTNYKRFLYKAHT